MSYTKVFLSDTLTNWVQKTNTISEDVGDLTLLGTLQDSDLVGAINELHDSINQLNTFVDPDTALVTSSATVSGAINELDGARDSAAANMNQLNIDRDSAAININTLNNDRDSAAVNINTLNNDRDSAAANINTLNINRDSAAIAINTLFNRVDSIDTETNAPTGNLADLTDSISGASRDNLVAAINDTYEYASQIDASNITSNEKIGVLTNLTTDAQNTLVDAINEIDATTFASGNDGIDVTGTLGGSVTVSHAETSAQADISNSGTSFIQSLTFDTFGHVVSATSNTVSDASTSVKGIASFSPSFFDVTNGEVEITQNGITFNELDKVSNPGDGEILSYSAIDGKLKFVAQTGGVAGSTVNVNQAPPDISGGLITGDSVNIIIEDVYGYWELELYTDSVTSVTGNAGGSLVVDANTDVLGTSNIEDSAITTAKIDVAAVTTPKIADNSVTTAKIVNEAVTTAKILDGNITTAKIANTNVTTGKIANNAVTTAKILDANVTTAKINDNAIIAAKIADGEVPYNKLDVVANPGNDEVLSYSAGDGKLKWIGQTGGSSSVNVGNVAPTISGGTISGDNATLTIDDSTQSWFLEVYDDSADVSVSGAGGTSILQYDTVNLGDWNLRESAGDLLFNSNGTTKMRLTSAGDLIAAGDITGFGTP